MSVKKKKGGDFKLEGSPSALQDKKLENIGSDHLHVSTRFAKHLPSSTSGLSKSASKSEDSLDSGVYARQKSHDSMDSLDSTESGFIIDTYSAPVQGLSPTEESIPLPSQYEDYLRECQDIRQSIIVSGHEEEKQPVCRTDSGDDQEDDTEAEWLRMAGLSDLVVRPSANSANFSSRVSTDSLSSMTVLSTLTRPQREAVLRRITSFNRAQKTKKRPKPTISTIFPTVELEPVKSPSAVSPTYSPENKAFSQKNEDPMLKSTSLPRGVSGFGDDGYLRRYSEATRPVPKDLDNVDSTSHQPHVSPTEFTNSNRTDYRSNHKKHLSSIVATESTEAAPDLPEQEEQSLSGNAPGCVSSTSMFDNVLGSDSYSLASKSLPDFKVEPELLSDSRDKADARHVPSFVHSSHSKRSVDRAKKSLSDVTLSAVVIMTSDSRARLNLQPVDNFPDESSSLTLSDNIFTIILSPSSSDPAETGSALSLPSKPSRHSAPSDTLERTFLEVASPPGSPQRNRFRLSPHFLFPLKRRSPASSPFKSLSSAARTGDDRWGGRKDSKLSPLHKVAELSPSRTGSYKLHSSPSRIHRRSLRRSRSLKSGRNISLVSVKSAQDGIETLRITPKGSGVDSWGPGKDDPSLQSLDEPKAKSLSYTETAEQPDLPNFSLVRDRLGITKISDLSSVDIRKVQSLALIEVTALFDLRGIDFKRRKMGKSKIKETGVFGIPLTTLVEWDQKRVNNPALRVPLVLEDIITFLLENAIEDEGILRKSGSSARIKALKQTVDSRYGYTNSAQDASVSPLSDVWTDAHPNDVAALLKQFLRELPDPLLTTEYLDAFQSCGLISDRKEQLQALNLLIILLNEVHRDSLKLLLKYLERVVACEQMNKMSLNNVAMITAPNLFLARKQNKKETSTSAQDLKHAAGTSNIVRMLIKYNKLLWTVPAFMLTQVRHMNRADLSSKKHAQQKEKSKIKFFQAKTKDLSKKSSLTITQPFDFETPKGVIRVQAPDMIMTSMAVQLDNQITAGDIIGRFKRQCERIDPRVQIDNSALALFEVGGNINERCLDPETNMNALMRVNPDTTLVIKPIK